MSASLSDNLITCFMFEKAKSLIKRIKIINNIQLFCTILTFAIIQGQGQSLSRVGLYINRPIFTHGMLYVGVSRSRYEKGLKIFLPDETTSTTNIVYYELL